MNHESYLVRRTQLMDSLEPNSIVVLFAGQAPQKSADEYYDFVPNKNFYYLTGIERDKMIVMLQKFNNRIETLVFIEKPNPVSEKWVGKVMSTEEIQTCSGIQDVYDLGEFTGKFHKAATDCSVDCLYLDLESRGWEAPFTNARNFAKEVSEKYPYLTVRNIFHMISDARVIKTEDEIACIRKAIETTAKGVVSLMQHAKAGMWEYELEAYFDFVLKMEGIQEHAFHTIAASGKNATVLHYSANNCSIPEDSLILFDLGAKVEHYSADITRTFPVSGRFTERQKELYSIVLQAQKDTIKAIKPGAAMKSLNLATRKSLSQSCKKIGLIHEDTELSRYYFHGVSHFLGLDTHDVGNTDCDLRAGMILTVEPGLYIEEENIGIRIEDNVLITEDGCTLLSSFIPKEIEEIEAFMQKGSLKC